MKFFEWLKDEYDQLEESTQKSLRVGLGVIAIIMFIVLMAVFSPANAKNLVAKDASGNTVTLTDKKCSIPSPWFKDWLSGTLTYKGKLFQVCWRISGTTVVVLDSEGDVTPVPMRFFHSAVEANAS